MYWSLAEAARYDREENRCECGCWTKQVWRKGPGEHDDDWYDEWICNNPRHKKETP